MNPLFQFLHGKAYKLNGIAGKFEHRVSFSRYYNRTMEDLSFTPTAAGKRTEAYQKVKRELGDDWSSNLTQAIEIYCEAARKLGYE